MKQTEKRKQNSVNTESNQKVPATFRAEWRIIAADEAMMRDRKKTVKIEIPKAASLVISGMWYQ